MGSEWRNLPFRMKVLFVLVPLLLLLNVPVFMMNLNGIEASRRSLAQTRDVLLELERGSSQIREAETVARLYLTTGQPEARAMYREARARVEESLARLRSAIGGRESQMNALNRLEGDFHRQADEWDRLIELRERRGAESFHKIFGSRLWEEPTHTHFSLMQEMEQEERERLDERRGAFDERRWLLTASLLMFSLLALAMLFMVYFFWRRDRQRQREAALRLEERDFRMRFVAGNAPVIFWSVDERGRFTMMQGKGLEAWGLRPDQLVGATYLESLPPGPEFGEDLETAMAGRAVNSTFRMGTDRWYESSMVPLDGGQGVVGLLVDITEVKRSEREAAEGNEARGRFLTNVSHEIRTPLGIIQGFTEVAMSRETPAEDRFWYLRKIRQHAEGLGHLLDDVLDLSRVEAGGMTMESIETPLRDFLREIEENFLPRARERGLLFSVHLSDRMPAQVMADPIRLRQILLNLVGNAFKFTERGSVVLKVDAESAKSTDRVELIFTIEDTGIGIDPAVVPRLFKPFMQADSSTKRLYGGSGLGLVLSRRLIEAMGGRLELVSSEVGVGSVFRFRVPARTTNESVPKAAGAAPVPQGEMGKSARLAGRRILMVDDSPDNRRLIEVYLRNQGAEIETADDGEQGIEKALRGRYDVVLMDIQMPRIDGFEATRRLRERGFDRPILALTAHAMNEERQNALISGFDDYMTKPVKFTELINRIEAAANPSSNGRAGSS